MDNIIEYHARIKWAMDSHKAAIEVLESEVNANMGGDCSISDIVGLMIVLGWKPPAKEAE